MSVEEVVKASNGTAAELNNPGRNISPWQAKLVAPYQAGDFRFEAVFNFEKAGGLAAVTLKLTSGDCNKLEQALGEQYGTPFEKADVFGPLLKWRDTARDALIQYHMFRKDCDITYFRLSKPGL